MSDSAPIPLSSLSQPDRRALLAGIRLIATDVDGTLTTRSSLGGEVVSAIERVTAAGIEVVPVSGRPTGELAGLVRYVPGVTRGIAENGLVEVAPDQRPALLEPVPDREALKRVGRRLDRDHDAGLELAADDYCRLGDVAYERAGRGEELLVRLRRAALALGAHLIWSSVHIHLSHSPPDKGRGVLALVARLGVAPDAVLTLGDAPNDGGLFESGRFGVTVGTSAVLGQLAHFPRPPQFVTDGGEGIAFLELAEHLLDARQAGR